MKPSNVVLCASLLGACVWSAPAQAEILWRGDFETQDLSQWNEVTGPVNSRVSFVSDPLWEGRFAARVEIRPGDLMGQNNRVEFGRHWPAEGFEGSERWYRFVVQTSGEAPIGPSWHSFTYFEAEVIYTPVVTFRLYAGNELRFCTHMPNQEEVHWTTIMQPDQWHVFMLHVLWSPDPDTGMVELWYDGEQVVAPVNVRTMLMGPDGPVANFLHQGVIRDPTLTGTEVLFFDGTIEATSMRDLMVEPGGTTGTTGDADGSGSDGGSAEAGPGSGEGSGATDEGVDPDSGPQGTTSGGSDELGSGSDDLGSGSSGSDSAAAEEAPGSSGCGCNSAGTLGWGWLLVLWRRRRH